MGSVYVVTGSHLDEESPIIPCQHPYPGVVWRSVTSAAPLATAMNLNIADQTPRMKQGQVLAFGVILHPCEAGGFLIHPFKAHSG